MRGPVVGDWITYNQGVFLVSLEILEIRRKRILFGFRSKPVYEVAAWVIVDPPGSCFGFPLRLIDAEKMKYIISSQRPTIRVTPSGKIVAHHESVQGKKNERTDNRKP